MGLVALWHVAIFPDQGSGLCLLHWQVYSLPVSHRDALFFFFYLIN